MCFWLALKKVLDFIKSLLSTSNYSTATLLLSSSSSSPPTSSSSPTSEMISSTSTSTSTKANPTCPGSPSWKHAKCSMTITIPKPTTCDMVHSELLSRISGENGWVDPHNQGVYKLLSQEKTINANGNDINQISGSRTTANGQYTDMFILTLEDDVANGGGCILNACSESQVFSILDFSTNYCNLRNLYCNSSDGGCPVVKHDFQYEETYVSCWQRDAKKCISSDSDSGNDSSNTNNVGFGGSGQDKKTSTE